MQKSILYAKIAISQKKKISKFSFNYYIGLFIFMVAIMLQILNNV